MLLQEIIQPTIKQEEIEAILAQSLSENLFEEEDSSVVFYNLARYQAQLEELKEAFPPNATHAIAVKANPLQKILSFTKENNCGFEVASLPELKMALQTGVSPNKIIFDSPAKTKRELAFALEQGVHINADNFTELERIDSILQGTTPKGSIGVRINPQVGLCKYSTTSVAGTYSKFGISINPFKEELVEAFIKYPWLSGVHLHIGSQGCNLLLLMEGVRILYDFVLALKKNPQIKQPIRYFDIGGGLPAYYQATDPKISLFTYADLIAKHCPLLFTDEFVLITEFGRYLHANNGWVATRVEYVKDDPKGKTAILHVGADMFLREAYHPNDWHHNFSVANHAGKIKRKVDDRYTLAGPLCFAGDMIAKKIPLPSISEGDFVLIHDAGAYTFGMWSKYNSRAFPKVIGYHSLDNLSVLKQRETFDQIEQFWR